MSPRWIENPDVRKGRHVVYNLHAHLVFVTKYRRGAFTDAMLDRCEEVMREVCADFEAELREFNGETDHVHLLVHYPPKVALSKLVNSLKGVSARYLRQEFDGHVRRFLWGGHFWSGSYFAGSCGGAPLAIVKEYIEQQKRPIETWLTKATGLSRWCATESFPFEQFDPDNGDAVPVDVPGHDVCAGKRWHETWDPEHNAGPEEAESWACRCTCHTEASDA